MRETTSQEGWGVTRSRHARTSGFDCESRVRVILIIIFTTAERAGVRPAQQPLHMQHLSEPFTAHGHRDEIISRSDDRRATTPTTESATATAAATTSAGRTEELRDLAE